MGEEKERAQMMIQQFDAISRERPLTEGELSQLENVIRRVREREGRIYFVWLPRHNLAIATALRHPRPGVVLKLAEQFGVSERAVWRQITRLRKDGKVGYISKPGGTGRYPRNGSKADQGADQLEG